MANAKSNIIQALESGTAAKLTPTDIGGKVRIAHCFNEGAAQKLKELLHAEFSKLKIEHYACRGLCSFYAEKGGLLVGFERC